MKLVRSDAAVSDVDEIWFYVAQDSTRAADKLVDRLDESFNKLLDFPRMGVPRHDIADGVRALRVDNLIIFYRAGPDAVSIERVLHARRDATKLQL